MALTGGSLGGYLAPRGASGEPRLAACIADPGSWGIAAGFRGLATKLGLPPEVAANLGAIAPDMLDRIWQMTNQDRQMRWKILQRGFWANGAADFRDFLRRIETFTMDGRAELIRCPTLLTMAENDPLAAGAPAFFEALRCPKQFLRFTAAEGAGGHCEMGNRSLLNRRVFDWLDGVFGEA